MATAIIGIGLPGSSRSRLLQELRSIMAVVYVCLDDIRTELTGNPMDQTRNADAWQIAFERIQAALVSGLDVIVDATNYKVEDRKRLIDFCKQWPSVKVSGMYVMTPYQVCLANNEAHEHVVPAHAMERMHKALSDDPPVKSEGWDVLERRFI